MVFRLNKVSFHNPFAQSVIAVIMGLVLMFIARILSSNHYINVEQRFPWLILGTLMLVYIIFNGAFSLVANDINQYWFRSIIGFAGLVIGGGGLAYLFSHLEISEAGTYKFIFIVLAIGYLVFISILRFIRKIVEYAQQPDDRKFN